MVGVEVRVFNQLEHHKTSHLSLLHHQAGTGNEPSVFAGFVCVFGMARIGGYEVFLHGLP